MFEKHMVINEKKLEKVSCFFFSFWLKHQSSERTAALVSVEANLSRIQSPAAAAPVSMTHRGSDAAFTWVHRRKNVREAL